MFVVQSRENYRTDVNEILLKMAFIFGSDIGLFWLRYISPFLDGGSFSDVMIRQNNKITKI